MQFKIVDYQPEYEKELLDLFYQSIFYKKKEFEYVRVPNSWIFRYTLAEDYIVKIAKDQDKIIGSVGLLIRKGFADGKSIKIGCFVDNCILPKYQGKYEEVFQILFNELENSARDKKVDVIQGWDFLKNIERRKSLWETLGYTWIEGVNWYPGGFDYKGGYPFEWRNNVSLGWKVFFKCLSYYNTIKEKFLPTLPEGVRMRNMGDDDIPSVYRLLTNGHRSEFAPDLKLSEFQAAIKKNNIHGIVAEKNGEILGALTYITSAWSGWMYGKPYYSDRWQVFYTFTPDEFEVLPEYRTSSLPSHMIIRLLKLMSPHKEEFRKGSHGFVADIFDRRIEWRRKAYLKAGCFEPKADFGAILCKALKSGLKLNNDKIWSLPAGYILAPVPPITDSKSDS